MDTGDLIDAVRAHRAVEIRYREDDESMSVRVLHPHALYRTSGNHLRLQALQVSGSSSRPLPAWRDFDLMRIVHATVLGVAFAPSKDFKPTSSRYRHGLIASA
jgi:predicted DNA-binding transcriptional regulator YafY